MKSSRMSTSRYKLKKSKQKILGVLLVLTIIPSLGSAQVFTFDYLTYFDRSSIPKKTSSYAFAPSFFFGNGEFSNGDNISYLEYHLYMSCSLNFKKKFQFSLMPQLGGLRADDISSSSYGDLWFFGKYRLPNVPFAFRLGFKLGNVGKSLWLKQNDLDLGVLMAKRIHSIDIDGALSYRIRDKSTFELTDFITELPGRFDQPGNALYYKFQFANPIDGNLTPSIFVLGYFSGNKKLEDMVIADSKSSKISLGASVNFQNKNDRSYELSFLTDVAGKRDKKGLAFTFVLRN